MNLGDLFDQPVIPENKKNSTKTTIPLINVLEGQKRDLC